MVTPITAIWEIKLICFRKGALALSLNPPLVLYHRKYSKFESYDKKFGKFTDFLQIFDELSFGKENAPAYSVLCGSAWVRNFGWSKISPGNAESADS